MKKLLAIIAGLMLVCAARTAPVQGQGTDLFSITIPFDFAISDKTLPAGDYHLRRNVVGAHAVLQLYSEDYKQSVFLPVTHSVQATVFQNKSNLVFNRYHEQFFLSQVWIAGNSTGEELRKTSEECVLRREALLRGNKREMGAVILEAN